MIQESRTKVCINMFFKVSLVRSIKAVSASNLGYAWVNRSILIMFWYSVALSLAARFQLARRDVPKSKILLNMKHWHWIINWVYEIYVRYVSLSFSNECTLHVSIFSYWNLFCSFTQCSYIILSADDPNKRLSLTFEVINLEVGCYDLITLVLCKLHCLDCRWSF